MEPESRIEKFEWFAMAMRSLSMPHGNDEDEIRYAHYQLYQGYWTDSGNPTGLNEALLRERA